MIAGSSPAGRRRVLRAVLSLALVGIIFFVVLPRIADFDAVWRVLRRMTWLEGTSLVLAAGWNLVTYWLLMMLVLPGLSFWRAMMVTETSTAIANTIPGGAVFGLGAAYSMFSSWGFDRARTALAIGLSGFADMFAKLLLPVIAVVCLAVLDELNIELLYAAGAGLVVLIGVTAAGAAVLRSEDSARRMGRRIQRTCELVLRPWERSFAGVTASLMRVRAEARTLFAGRWIRLIGTSFLSQLSLFLVLLVALRHVGIPESEVGWAEALGAFAFVRFLSAVPLTPGGLGVVELGLTAGLVVAGGPEAEVVAAVLVFRALTYLVQIPFGAATYLSWQHRVSPPAGTPGAVRASNES